MIAIHCSMLTMPDGTCVAKHPLVNTVVILPSTCASSTDIPGIRDMMLAPFPMSPAESCCCATSSHGTCSASQIGGGLSTAGLMRRRGTGSARREDAGLVRGKAGASESATGDDVVEGE